MAERPGNKNQPSGRVLRTYVTNEEMVENARRRLLEFQFQNAGLLGDRGPDGTQKPAFSAQNKELEEETRRQKAERGRNPEKYFLIGGFVLAAMAAGAFALERMDADKKRGDGSDANGPEVTSVIMDADTVSEANELLLKGVKNNNLGMVRKAFEKGADSDMGTDRNYPAFLAVCGSGKYEMAKLFIENGATVNYSNGHMTPLMTAADNKQAKIVDLLLANGADFNATTDYGSVLNVAAGAGNLEIVRALVVRGADVELRKKVEHKSPVLAAAENGHLEIVEYLFAKGAKIDVTVNGKNALTLAIENGYEKVANFLLKNSENVMGIDELRAAARRGNIQLAKKLVGKGASFSIWVDAETPLMAAAEAEKLEMVNYLLGASFFNAINAEDEIGENALMKAAKKGNPEIVRALIKKGADLNAKDDSGKTALAHAESKGNKRMYDLLLSSGAKY